MHKFLSGVYLLLLASVIASAIWACQSTFF